MHASNGECLLLSQNIAISKQPVQAVFEAFSGRFRTVFGPISGRFRPFSDRFRVVWHDFHTVFSRFFASWRRGAAAAPSRRRRDAVAARPRRRRVAAAAAAGEIAIGTRR